MIKIKYSAIDGYTKRKSFKSLAGARKYAQEMVGKNPDFGSYYAVSDDGVGKIEVIDGVKLRELFGDPGGNPDPVIDHLEAAYEEEMRAQQERDRAETKAEYEEIARLQRPARDPGCTCSDQQLYLVGCDCDASRMTS